MRSKIRTIAIMLAIVPGLGMWSATTRAGEKNDAVDLRFSISFTKKMSAEPLTGRMFLVFAKSDSVEPRLQVGRYGVPFFGADVSELLPGRAVEINRDTDGYPIASLADIPPGTYHVQAVLNKYTLFNRKDGHRVWMHDDRWEGQNWRKSPGNLVSDVREIRVTAGESKQYSFELDRKLPELDPPKDTKWVKYIKIQSDLLTEFWGRPVYLGAAVLLPRGYESHPESRYPVVYQHGHFSLRAPLRFDRRKSFEDAWKSENIPRFIAVTMQHPTPYFDDSYAVNSVNNGPYGDAIHQELIPEIEKQFRVIAEPWARVLTGGSTGGWISFALQVFYPDFYGGTWSFSPDPLDFRNVEGIDIYKDTNAFYKQYEWYRVPIINTRFAETAAVRLTSKQRNVMEFVHGTKGRSGQQLDIWSAVFGPLGDDGYFKPLFDKQTGTIDPEVAPYWRENYDLRHILERDWQKLGPKLVGKLHVICGHMDDFFLNMGVYHMEKFLESTREPYYGGSFTYGARGSHRWRPYSTEHLLRLMAQHIIKNAPAEANTAEWNY